MRRLLKLIAMKRALVLGDDTCDNETPTLLAKWSAFI